MWAHRAWPGRWSPDTTRPGEELAAYARLCTAVEGNTTFYALPDERTVARWAEQVPSRFRFAFKLPRVVTHVRRLRDAGVELRAFIERLAPLAPWLGPTSVQLPASFGPEDLGVLAAFVERLPTEWSWAVEVRHPGFFDGGPHGRALDELLHRHGLDRVVLDSRALFAGPCRTAAEREAFDRKPRLPVRPVATGRQPVVRFIGQVHPDANASFWTRWFEPLARWAAEGREPLVFVHTPDNVDAPMLARRLHAELAASVEAARHRLVLDSLPDPPPVRSQASLW